ncbi:MAG: hypothetical protein FD131_3630 [Rhodocyclaceae bacterium]|nr:MAG: hypothetical protein FD131_3630 [Rhodocyclaceae bacterium]
MNLTPLKNYGSDANPWRGPDGTVIACHEKLKVMSENLEELRDMALAALEDAVLMGCAEDQVKAVFAEIIDQLSTRYEPR